jgi:hypothetical protein
MRTRTTSDSVVPAVSRYDLLLMTLPLPLFVGVTVGLLSDLPAPPVVGVSGLVSVAVLAFGLFVATPTTPTGSRAGSVDASDATGGDDTERARRRRGV